MARREIPLFIFDKNRWHRQGAADFLVCTDMDNGFIARVDYVNEPETVTDTVRISKGPNGINLKLEIRRMTGANPSSSAIRTLMKKGSEYITENGQVSIDTNNPSTQDCIDFLTILINSNRQNVQEAGSDSREKEIVMTSLSMLEAIRKKLTSID